MLTTTIRVSRKTQKALKKLAMKQEMTMEQVIDSMLEQFRREQFLNDLNRGYEALKKNNRAWQQELKERELFESALMDDLQNE